MAQSLSDDASNSEAKETSEDAPRDSIETSLRIAAPPATVFALLTDPDQISLWFAQVAGIEPRVGGAVEFVFFNDNGSVSVFSGEVIVFEANMRFSFTWHHKEWSFPPLRVNFALEGDDRATVLSLRQDGFAAAPAMERDVHAEGWQLYLERLAAVADGTRPEGWNA